MSPRHSSEPSQPLSRLTLLAGGALGVVFGDIGTSPLYTFSRTWCKTRPTCPL
nr:KUP/HAK/KT family potassium transporter [Enterobacter asburiae]